MTQPSTVTVSSTADLEPAGASGYTKAIAAFLQGLILVVLPFIDSDAPWAKYVAVAVAVLGFFAVYGLPNAVKPIQVAVPPTPAGNLDVDVPGQHAAQE